jgi:predicted N-acetyltransferase YhbS
MTDDLVLAPERLADGPLVEGLIARAFGPGRFAKAAERLREGRAPIRSLSFVAWKGDTAVGCVRLWPVTIGATPAILLGPFAVDDPHRKEGLGAALIERACEAAAQAGHGLILLVGDGAYFARLGFGAEPARAVVMPGPVDQRRVLARALRLGADAQLSGGVRPAEDGLEMASQTADGAPHPRGHRASPTPGAPE